MSINVSVCLCVVVLSVRFAFSFALESLKEEGKDDLPMNCNRRSVDENFLFFSTLVTVLSMRD